MAGVDLDILLSLCRCLHLRPPSINEGVGHRDGCGRHIHWSLLHGVLHRPLLNFSSCASPLFAGFARPPSILTGLALSCHNLLCGVDRHVDSLDAPRECYLVGRPRSWPPYRHIFPPHELHNYAAASANPCSSIRNSMIAGEVLDGT
jgi:hypothetical protein